MIRDRLMVGIRELAFSERLQTDEILTLDKAKKLIQQQQILRKGGDSSLDYMGKQTSGWSVNRGLLPKCSRCGKSHPKNQCPAKDTVCYKCHRHGHIGNFCFSKTMAAVLRGDTFR